MRNTNESEIDIKNTIQRICEFFRLEKPTLISTNLKDIIKELCVIRLCKAIGLRYSVCFKSDFFDFFASLMGEAVSQKLSLKVRVACDELRLIKYNRLNLIQEIKSFLENETVEEAFIDAFELADRFKYIIPTLKKSS